LGADTAYNTVKTSTTIGTNSSTFCHERTIVNNMTSATKFSDVSYSYSGYAEVEYNGDTYNISMAASNTIGDFMAVLAGYGIDSSIDENGVLTVQGTSNGFIKYTGGFISELGIYQALDTSETTLGANTTSDQLNMVATEATMNSKSVKMTNLQTSRGENLGITTGDYYIYENGVRTTHSITEDTTLNDFMSELAEYGIVADITEDGSLMLNGHENSYLATSAKGGSQNTNMVDILFSKWDFTNVYNSNNLDIPTPVVQSISRETKMSNIAEASNSGGFQEGLVTIVRNGVQTQLYINSTDTVGTFMDELSMYGFESVINDKGQIIIKNSGDSQIQAYTGTSQASNILEIIGAENDDWVISKSYESQVQNVITFEDLYIDATEDTKLSDIAKMTQQDAVSGSTIVSEPTSSFADSLTGNLEIVLDGETNYINISSDETIGSVLDKFRAMGLEANIAGGKITIHSGYKDLNIVTPTDGGSKIVENNLLTFNNDIGGYTASSQEVISTTYEDKVLAAAGWANGDTKLSTLGISTGTFSVYKDGINARVEITAGETFSSLQSKIRNTLSDVTISFNEGFLTFSSESGKVTAGSSTDTSNFASVTAIKAKADGTVASSKELYTVDHSSKVTKEGAFRFGNVTTGTFTVGTHEITIDENTTIDDIISSINSHPLESGASAYWDEFEGNLVIKSRTAGNAFVNIEAGTSNFTDVMGLTKTVGTGADAYSAMNTETQTVGGNARISIDGVVFTANSNTIGSEVTRIQGLTLNLKEVTEGEAITISVEKDKEVLADAVEDVVNCYNELMTGVDEAIAAGGDLADQTTLKMIRNQLRSYMTSASLSATDFRNFDAIGISVSDAVGSNISTKTSDIVTLNFNRDIFYSKYKENPFAVKALMVGDTTNKGVLLRVEDLIESALAGVNGYFDTQNASYNNQISTINKQIQKANEEVAKYKEMLESKFSSMDMLIAQMQEQYSSFLKS
ncbi:MAG: flagellar filament capping protein FliD, partial [Cyanobacteria bacterium RUI128]|nr:flagellar filament capping protein FliD [Cyanobacteria bacterium RUI128]